MNDFNTHPWIEGYEEYEAVLLVKNPIQTWETNAIIRAFQLHQWDGIQVGDGDETGDLSIVHTTSGTIVHYDGQVLAIDRGDTDLNEAFTDLFLVLRHLGWQNIEVYHSLATMGDLLQDMGRSIPASMEMNIFPFNHKANIESTANADHINSVISNNQQTSSRSEESMKIAARFQQLLPEEAEEGATTTSAQDTNTSPRPGAVGSEEPTIPTLDEPDSPPPASIEHEFVSHTENSSVFQTQAPVAENVANAVQPETTRVEAPQKHVVNEVQTNEDGDKYMRIGKCVIAFDTPETPISNIEALAHALKSGIPESRIAHLHPGETTNQYHWDALGEIPECSPWLAVTLVQDMFPDEKALHLIAGLFLAVRKENPKADFRYVLSIITDAEKTEAALTSLSPETKTFAESSQFNAGKVAVINALGAIALVPAGNSFVDINVQTDGKKEFTVKQLAAERDPLMLVVHTDHLDSYFTRWIVGVMQKFIMRHRKSKRFFNEEDKDAAPLVVVNSEQLVDIFRQYQQISDSLKRMGLPAV